MVCHSRAANFVLGPSVVQMNKPHNYGKVTDEQLRTLERLGMFRVNVLDHLAERRQRGDAALGDYHRLLEAPLLARADLPRAALPPAWAVLGVAEPWRPAGVAAEAKQQPAKWLEARLHERPRFTSYLPKPPHRYPKLVDPYDPRQPLEERARSYLHANCAHCHQWAGGGNAKINLEFFAPPADRNLINEPPQHDKFGIPDAKIIAPGHPEKSVLYLRMARRGPGQMPPLATAHEDRAALELLGEWIRQMPAPRGR
jgi:hypothetical protein